MTRPPRAWFDTWPREAARPGTPAAATWLARLATQLEQHLNDSHETLASFAARSGLAASTIRGVLDGRRWPTTHTVHAVIETMKSDVFPPFAPERRSQ